jgi:hypothetical protein
MLAGFPMIDCSTVRDTARAFCCALQAFFAPVRMPV